MPRPRLHKSSIIVGTVVALLVVLIEIPGRVVSGDIGGEPSMVFEHGWPWVYLRREIVERPVLVPSTTPEGLSFAPCFLPSVSPLNVRSDLPHWGVPWMSAANWRFWEVDKRSDPAHCKLHDGIATADFLVAAAVVTLAAVAWEFRRRSRPRLLSFGLGDLFVLITLASVTCGWLTYQQRESQRESQLLKGLKPYLYDGFTWDEDQYQCVAPLWIQSLIGPRWLPQFSWRVSAVIVYALPIQEQEFLQLRELRYLNRFEFTHWEPSFRMSAVASLPDVTTLDISNCADLDDRNYDDLVQLTQLRTLVVDKNNIPPETLSRIEDALPNCEIVDYSDEW
jgi:hypothetical protein